MKRVVMLALSCALVGLTEISAQENQVKRLPEVPGKVEQTDYSSAQQGFWISAEVSGGASLRLESRNVAFGELDVTGGYRFNQYLRVGLGFGGRYYVNNDGVRRTSIPWTFPVYANVRGNFISDTYRTCVPYYSLDAGVAIRDGFMIRPTVGLRIGQPRSAFLIGLSYVGQVMRGFDCSDGGIITDRDRFTSMLALRLGYEF